MHPDLSPHLHTDECNDLISQLKKCHAEVRPSLSFSYCFIFNKTYKSEQSKSCVVFPLSTTSWNSSARVTKWTAPCVIAWRKRSVSYFFPDFVDKILKELCLLTFDICFWSLFVSLPFNRGWKNVSAVSSMQKWWKPDWKKDQRRSCEGHFTTALPLELRVKSIQILGHWILLDTV